MRLLEATIDDFRNIPQAQLVFSRGVNVFLGGNGQGKSNLLEALNYPALGRSHRGGRDDDLIRFGADSTRVRVAAESDDGTPLMFEVLLARGVGRRLRVDGRPVARRADLVGKLAAVVFDPETVALASGAPDLRRRFVDHAISSLDRDYFEQLQAYQRALRQKARLLRDGTRTGRSRRGVTAELTAWNQELARHAAPLCESRAEYARRLALPASDAYADLDRESPSLTVDYRPCLRAFQGGRGGQELLQEILEEFAYIGEDETRRGRPLAGPHLDDFEIRLGGIGLRGFGSRGEARSAALALKLAHGELIFQQRRVRPVFFFDDVFSELDKARARRLQERCAADHQLLIATARADDIERWRPEGLRTWRVRAGSLEEMA